MRIGLLESPPPPPPLSLPPQPATNSAAAARAGAHHRSLLIPLLLTPLQTFAAIDCDGSRPSAVLSSAKRVTPSGPHASAPRRRRRAARREGRAEPDLRRVVR